jgi:DNA adenine methylase
LGGGAAFFALAAEKRFERAVLSDFNLDLVNAYRVVRGFPDDLMRLLVDIERAYEADPKRVYDGWKKPEPELAEKLLKRPISRAARLIFLNKAGFNGLYRVNRKGGFNVPWGKKAKVRTHDEANLHACSAVLDRWASLRHGDFEAILADAGFEDLVYLDPPYVPKNQTSSFTGYTGVGFGVEAQRRVARVFRDLHARGCYVVTSNAAVPLVREMYEGFEMHEVQARRSINVNGDGRGTVGEVIIVSRRS